MTRRRLYLLTITLILAAGGIFALQQYQSIRQGKSSSLTIEASGDQTLELTTVEIGDKKYTVEVAKSIAQKSEGLSSRPRLSANHGMLFVFNPPERPKFWMRDMKFPIDIVWIDNGEIVEITSNLSPPTEGTSLDQLELYQPKQDVTHVLELNAGEASALKAGDKIIINNIKSI